MSDMSLSEELQWRGMIKDRTFEDLQWINNPRKFYLGIDCSADSLTIGNLATYMLAKHLVEHGWKAVLLVGGATSLIGDPGGKSEERQLKSKEEIEKNVEGVKAQVARIFAGIPFESVNNYDWFKDLGYLEFLREVGKHFSITELVQRDFIAARMGEGGSGISYAEFSYSLIQGYDFWWLFKNMQVELQIGGSDQWGNMLSGAQLIRKKEEKEAHALSMPLVINQTTGVKFGKSEEGAIWLDAKRTSVYKFYQFWLNVDDEGVRTFLALYTMLTKQEVDKVLEEFNSNRSTRLAQKTLAYEVTKLVHGEDAVNSVSNATKVLFGESNFSDLNDEDVELLRDELPSVSTGPDSTVEELLAGSGLAGSKSEGSRLISSNAVSVNGKKITTGNVKISEIEDVKNGKFLIQKGKNSFAIAELQ